MWIDFNEKTMNIQVNKPYKIIPLQHRRYAEHYHIPSHEVIVVPQRNLGDEVMCDIRWLNEEGNAQVIHNAMFKNENLLPVNPVEDDSLFEIWAHFFGGRMMVSSTKNAIES